MQAKKLFDSGISGKTLTLAQWKFGARYHGSVIALMDSNGGMCFESKNDCKKCVLNGLMTISGRPTCSDALRPLTTYYLTNKVLQNEPIAKRS